MLKQTNKNRAKSITTMRAESMVYDGTHPDKSNGCTNVITVASLAAFAVLMFLVWL